MDFNTLINTYENNIGKLHYKVKYGESPILITAVHTVYQQFKNKLPEPYTGAIAQYVAKETNSSYIIKSFDNGIDANSLELDDFKKYLIKFIKDNNIKLILDLHGAANTREFDIEFGTLNNLSSDIITIKTLENSFKEKNIHNISHNKIFKGGGITRTIFENIDVDVIQLEINKKYRDKNNLKECEKVCDSLIIFLAKYNKHIKK